VTTLAGRLHSQESLAAGVYSLVASDEVLARALALTGMPELRRRPAGFAGLVAVVTGQQLSVASARAILGRLEAALATLSPEALTAADDELLRAAGLSRPKIRHLRALAAALIDGSADLSGLPADPDAATAELVRLPGIGRWTAEIYLLFCLGHADVLPAGDLALQVAAADLLGLSARPSERELRALAERWRPHRGAAAHLLWAYYHVLKGGRSGAPA